MSATADTPRATRQDLDAYLQLLAGDTRPGN